MSRRLSLGVLFDIVDVEVHHPIIVCNISRLVTSQTYSLDIQPYDACLFGVR